MNLVERIQLNTALSVLPDEILVDADTVALMMDLSPVTIRQRRNRSIPRPIAGMRVLRWRLGEVRRAIRELPLS